MSGLPPDAGRALRGHRGIECDFLSTRFAYALYKRNIRTGSRTRAGQAGRRVSSRAS